MCSKHVAIERDAIFVLLTKICDLEQRKGRDDLLVEACLRIGAAEILFLDTPPYAVCKETVNVLRQVPSIRVR